MADFEYINIDTTAQKIEKMANLETTYSNEAGKIPMFTQNHTIRSGIPINALDCANKKYVDDAIANAGGGSVDLSNYYTKDEVDNLDAIQSISISGGYVHIIADNGVVVDGSSIKNVGNPIDTRDAATKGYVDDAIADTSGNYYTKNEIDNLDAIQAIDNIDGNVYISADYDVYVYGSLIKSVGTPRDATDAATKGYVDDVVAIAVGSIDSALTELHNYAQALIEGGNS